MNNEEKKKITFKDIITNKQYRAIANLVFYGCMILALIIFVRTTPTSSSVNRINSNDDNNITESSVDGFNYIKNKNYNFKYVLAESGIKTIYEGKQYNNAMSFVSNEKEYFYEDGIFLEKENDKYVLSEFKTKYFNYFNVDMIEKLISNCKIDEEEYSIDLKKFGEIIGDNTFIETNKEILIFLEKKNGIITKIEFDLSELSDSDSEISLILEYSNFGLIDAFSIKNN